MRRLTSILASGLVGLLALTAPASAETAKKGDVFGDWIYECAAVGESKEACALTQSLVDEKTGSLLVKFSMGRDEKLGTVSLVALVPLGIDLVAGVSGAIDDNQSFPFTVRTCLNSSCIAYVGVDQKLFQQMRQGSALKIGFRMINEPNGRVYGGSLRGITAGATAAGY